MTTLKHCAKCSTIKNINSFYKDSNKVDGRRASSADCSKKYAKQYVDKVGSSTLYNKHRKSRLIAKKLYAIECKDKKKNSQLKTTYGVSLDFYNKLLIKQNESCAICDTHESQLRIKLAVDHCHDTGKIRGLLCDRCNRDIGFLKESVLSLRKAANYLEGSKR